MRRTAYRLAEGASCMSPLLRALDKCRDRVPASILVWDGVTRLGPGEARDYDIIIIGARGLENYLRSIGAL